jgi:p21-activated kinase 1
LSKQASKGEQQMKVEREKEKAAAAAGEGKATPRRRTEKKTDTSDVVARLNSICTDADPTKLYRSLVKIGQG